MPLVIENFKDEDSKKIWEGVFTKKIPSKLLEKAQMKLALIDAASSIEELKIPPSNRLHLLKGSRKGQYSISINMQYRIIFNFKSGNAFHVEVSKHYEK